MATSEKPNFTAQTLDSEAMRKAVQIMLGFKKMDTTPLAPPRKTMVGALSKTDCE
jgi:hypothetical protein